MPFQTLYFISSQIHALLSQQTASKPLHALLSQQTASKSAQFILSTRLATSTNLFLFLTKVTSSSGKCSLTFVGPKVWSSIPSDINFFYLFVYSRHEVHSMNTHTLQNTGWKQTTQNVVQDTEAGEITGFVASWLTGPHQEYRQPQNSLIHVTSIRRAHKLGQQTCQQNVISENYETQPYAVRTLCPVL